MIIKVSEELLDAISKVEAWEQKRTLDFTPTFCWAYGSQGTSADGIAYNDKDEPFKQYDVSLPSNGEVWIAERPIYSDFEIQWYPHELSGLDIH